MENIPSKSKAANEPKKDAANDEEGKQTKKRKVTIKILASMPKNAKEQEELFFESECTMNPQFEYENPAVASKFIN